MKYFLIIGLFFLGHALGFSQACFHEFNFLCQDGVERPYIIFSPEAIDPSVEQPLLVFLHGAIGSKNLKRDPLKYMQNSAMVDLAREGGFYLMFCYGQKGASWFDDNGVSMVLGEIEEAQAKYKIDSNKIFLAGFSDGGSGVLSFSMLNPEPFAGFIAMNGSLAVADKLSVHDLYPQNMNDKPMYIINTKDDILYPIKQMAFMVKYLQQYNFEIVFRELDGDHDMNYLENEQERLLDFIQKNAKEDLPKGSWESSSPSLNNGWLKILEIDSSSYLKPWHHPYDLHIFNEKADFGMRFDYAFEGEGIKVKGFKNDNCMAKKMGVEIGDIILKMEEHVMTSVYAPMIYHATKKAGDKTNLTLERNGKEIMLDGTFNIAYFYPVFNYKGRSGKVMFDKTGDMLKLKTSGIAKLSIDFDQLGNSSFNKLFVNDLEYTMPLDGLQEFEVKK